MSGCTLTPGIPRRECGSQAGAQRVAARQGRGPGRPARSSPPARLPAVAVEADVCRAAGRQAGRQAGTCARVGGSGGGAGRPAASVGRQAGKVGTPAAPPPPPHTHRTHPPRSGQLTFKQIKDVDQQDALPAGRCSGCLSGLVGTPLPHHRMNQPPHPARRAVVTAAPPPPHPRAHPTPTHLRPRQRCARYTGSHWAAGSAKRSVSASRPPP